MVSKALTKTVRSLETKKGRQATGMFVAEGPKVVGDLMRKSRPSTIIAVREWLDAFGAGYEDISVVATDEELRRTSFLQHPQQVMALFKLPAECGEIDVTNNIVLALDGVQDPGNVGTIIRVADWFGIKTVVCGADTADAFSPKVVQATMGSIARVNVVYADLPLFLGSLPAGTPVYGTLLDGDNIYNEPLTANGVIVMGNEGKGISGDVRELINRRLLIPSFATTAGAESLNVAIATAITCSEFRRRPR